MDNQVKEESWVGHVAHTEDMRNLLKILARKPAWPNYGWDNTKKTGFKEAGCEGVNWIHLGQWRNLDSTLINLPVS
jgi:hypothetical protein